MRHCNQSRSSKCNEECTASVPLLAHTMRHMGMRLYSLSLYKLGGIALQRFSQYKVTLHPSLFSPDTMFISKPPEQTWTYPDEFYNVETHPYNGV
jgi:hypothetical protein